MGVEMNKQTKNVLLLGGPGDGELHCVRDDVTMACISREIRGLLMDYRYKIVELSEGLCVGILEDGGSHSAVMRMLNSQWIENRPVEPPGELLDFFDFEGK